MTVKRLYRQSSKFQDEYTDFQENQEKSTAKMWRIKGDFSSSIIFFL